MPFSPFHQRPQFFHSHNPKQILFFTLTMTKHKQYYCIFSIYIPTNLHKQKLTTDKQQLYCPYVHHHHHHHPFFPSPGPFLALFSLFIFLNKYQTIFKPCMCVLM